MVVVLLLHGLKDKEATGLKRLIPALEAAGYQPWPLYYGWFLIRGLTVWQAFNTPVARMLASFTGLLHLLGHTVICVAHSNGAAIAAKASGLGAVFDGLIFVNGAVERDVKLGPNTGLLVNCRIPTDPILAASWLISPVSPLAGLDGSLGNLGVKKNSDPRQWDIDLSEHFGIVASHGGFFAERNVERTGPWLTTTIKWMLGGGNQ